MRKPLLFTFFTKPNVALQRKFMGQFKYKTLQKRNGKWLVCLRNLLAKQTMKNIVHFAV